MIDFQPVEYDPFVHPALQPVEHDPFAENLDPAAGPVGRGQPSILDYAKQFVPGVGGGIYGAMKVAGAQTPEWMDAAARVAQNPDLNTAIGMAAPLSAGRIGLQAVEHDPFGPSQPRNAGMFGERDPGSGGFKGFGKQWSQDEIEQMRSILANGGTRKDVMLATGRNRDSVYRGVKLYAPEHLQDTTPMDINDDVQALAKKGLSQRQIATQLGVANSTVGARLGDMGVKTNPITETRASYRPTPGLPQLNLPPVSEFTDKELEEFDRLFGGGQ